MCPQAPFVREHRENWQREESLQGWWSYTECVMVLLQSLSYFWWVYLEKPKIQKGTCTHIFVAALFTVTKTWKQPKCSLTQEWIKKMWYVHTMEYYSAIKNKAICSNMDGPRECHLAWRIPGTGEPGGLPSMRSHRVGHDWSDLAALVCV